ncbi:hypothetical protein, partial [Bacteroides sp.]
MKKLNNILYASLFMASLFAFASCGEEEEAGQLSGQKVTVEIPVEILGMQQAGGGAVTRSADDVMETTFGAPETRTDLSAVENKIHSIAVIQFDGVEDANKVVAAKTGLTLTGGKVTFDAFNAANAAGRVYVVANFAPAVTVNTTTLGAFKKMMATYTNYTGVAGTGLPMCGYGEFNPRNTPKAQRIQLTAMVAKLTVTYTATAGAFYDNSSVTVKLKNVSNGTAYEVPDSYSTVFNPTGVTRTGTVEKDAANANLALGKTYTFYVPENICGANSAASTWKKRSLANVPTGTSPLYFEITGRTKDNKGTATVVSFIGDPAAPTEYNIRRNYAYTLTANINNINTGTGTADERITVKPDYFNLNTEGAKTGYANCYIVTGKENGAITDYGFDATVRGKGDESISGISYSSLPKLSDATEARVIWQTGGTSSVINSVKLDGGKVLFTLGSATEGNAVIGIFANSTANAPCLWSWHIWRLNGSAPGTVLGSKTSATTGGSVDVTMMDRNLGAYNNTEGNVGSIGLLYQWGRKDPFPGPVGFNTTEPSNIYGSYNKGGTTGSWNGSYSIQTVTTSASVGTELYATQYPTAYIVQPSSPYDWYYGSTRNDNLWGTPWVAGGTGSYNKNQGTKSIYDPCPIGYRVPPQDTWSKQTGNGTFRNNGIILGSFNSSLWFPAAGYRSTSMGDLGGASSHGRFWTSSPYAVDYTSSGFLSFAESE